MNGNVAHHDDGVTRAVGEAVLRWFQNTASAEKKHPASEWTVLAGVVLRVAAEIPTDAAVAVEDGATSHSREAYRVLACGTGTKCLGRRDLNADGLVVNDCHAEIVARRAFLRYLYREAQHWDQVDAGKEEEHILTTAGMSIFQRDPVTAKLRLKPGHELHLYISEAPCGDAAIYPMREDVVEALVRDRQRRDGGTAETATERSEYRLTGAKLRHVGGKRARDGETPGDNGTKVEVQPGEKRFDQVVGIARTKSGRSDLPFDKQTVSMSCSDKLARWAMVGIQGSLLLRWFEPLFLTSIVTNRDAASASHEAQYRALQRAIQGRLTDGIAPRVIRLAVLPNEITFSRRRLPGKTASSLSLNWTECEAHWKLQGMGSEQDRTPKSTDKNSTEYLHLRWMRSFFESTEVEILMGATGFKQGAKKAAKMDRAMMEKVASRLCKWSLYRAFHTILTTSSDAVANEPMLPYAAQKQQIRQHGYHSQFQTSSLASSWIGVPDRYKAFHLSLTPVVSLAQSKVPLDS